MAVPNPAGGTTILNPQSHRGFATQGRKHFLIEQWMNRFQGSGFCDFNGAVSSTESWLTKPPQEGFRHPIIDLPAWTHSLGMVRGFVPM
jgi:hypothetical protein